VPDVLVPRERVDRWLQNFTARHGAVTLAADGDLVGTAADGSTFRAVLPFGRRVEGEASVEAFVAATSPPSAWGLLLVRKGGFAVARLEHDRMADSKVGQRHVQGRTKAGGQSQQRFARRRDNQARAAYEAAADHTARILGGALALVVTGGDHSAVETVLGDRRLQHLRVVPPWLAVPDPRRSVLEQAAVDAASVRVVVHNA
jgi:Actinobacteria/chloroflexi VLRF1 release factor